MNETARDDDKVIDMVLDGRVDAYEAIVEKYKARVFAIVASRVPETDAGDVANGIFLRAFRGLASFQRRQPFENWLSSIAVRACCDYWRKQPPAQAVRPGPEDSERYLEWVDDIAKTLSLEEFEKRCAQSEAAEVLAIVLGTLAPEDRMIMELVYFEGLPLKDAASLLGWGLSKSKIRVMRAKMKMRRAIRALAKKEII